MESAPSIETVLQALQALYKSNAGDSGSHEKASQWLGEMQKSVYAWQIADQLIQMNKDEESCYFGAQTIRTKIQFAFHELPLDSHQALRDSLLKHCTKINDDTKNTIVTQLCLSLADLVVQMATWKTAIADLIKEFGSSRTHWAFLLEFLSVLPEEIGSRHLRLGDNRRNEVFDEMTNASPVLVELLTTVMEAALDDWKTKERVMHCVGSWLSVYAIPQQVLIGSKLLHLPFAVMANHETQIALHNAATKCICSALIAVEEDDVSKNQQLGELLHEGVTSLLEAYHMSVAIQDLEKSMNYCRIFTEMAETFLESMINSPNQGFGDLRTIELLLTCIGHYHFEVADITFNFWNRLSEALYDDNKPEVIAVFQPYVQRLVIALCRLCQYDSSQDGLPDEADDFEDFRARSIDLVKDVEFVVGATNIVVQMFETLKGSDGSGTPWQVAEAAIFIMAAVAKYIDLAEESAVPQVIQGITGEQGGTHLAVLHSSMNLIGEFSKWINVHPQLLESSMQFLLNGLHHPKLSTIAAESIQKLCSMCAEHMVGQFSGLLQVVQAIDTLNVTLSAGLGLLKACSLILVRLSLADITEGMRQLCILQVEPLSKREDAEAAEPELNTNNSNNSWICSFCYMTNCLQDCCSHCKFKRYEFLSRPMSWTTSGYPQQMVDVLPTEQTFRTVQRYISYKNPVAVRTFEGVVFPITSGNFDTGKKLVIQKVTRNENIHLHQAYSLLKSHWLENLGATGLSEIWVLHGTTSENVKAICTRGYNRGYGLTGNNPGSYGNGTYYATVSAHASKYAKVDAVGLQHVILTKLLAGRSAIGNVGLAEGPQIGITDERHETTVNMLPDATIYASFHDNQTFPAYVLSFVVQ